MREEELPKIVYKFRDWGSRYHSILLTDKTLYFPQPSTLNDPFDVALHYRYDLMSDEDRRNYISESASLCYPELSGEDLRLKVEEGIECSKSDGFHAHQMKVVREHADSAFGIFSTASCWKNNLLWSHYSCSHRGFCVGLDLESLLSHFGEQYTERFLIWPEKVNYVLNPNIHPSQMDRVRQTEVLLTTKSCVWKYEEEIRFLLVLSSGNKSPLTPEERHIPIPESAICEVVLGWKISREHKHAIEEALREFKHRPQLYTIIGSKMGAFELVRENSPY